MPLYDYRSHQARPQSSPALSIGGQTKSKGFNATSLLNLGFALFNQGDLEGAAKSIRQALQIRPGYTQAYINLGLVLCARGKLDDAVSVFRTLSNFSPDSALGYNNLGSCP